MSHISKRFILRKSITKRTLKRLALLNREQYTHIVKQFRKYRYRIKKAGKTAQDDTIINVIINKLL